MICVHLRHLRGNVGVELGQIAFVFVVLGIMALLRFIGAKLPKLEPISPWQLVPYAINVFMID